MYEYRARVINVVDGDTVDADIDLGFGIILRNERVRILGIDAPETRTRDRVEKLFGELATNRVKELLLDKDVVLQTRLNHYGEDMRGKFGRVLGDFIIDDEYLTEVLLREGHAVEFTGGNKSSLVEQHLHNRKRLLDEGKVTQEDIEDAEKETNNEK